MRTAISGTWVYAIVLIFMVILIAYVAITINYANTFEMSSDVIKIIEEGEGYNNRTRTKIEKYLRGNNQSAKHACNLNTLNKGCVIGVDGTNITKITGVNSGKYDYCMSRTKTTVQGKTTYYYQVSLFFNFSLPVLGDMWSFNVPGETAGMTYVTDDTFEGMGC